MCFLGGLTLQDRFLDVILVFSRIRVSSQIRLRFGGDKTALANQFVDPSNQKKLEKEAEKQPAVIVAQNAKKNALTGRWMRCVTATCLLNRCRMGCMLPKLFAL